MNQEMKQIINLRKINESSEFNWKIIIPISGLVFNGMKTKHLKVIKERVIVELCKKNV